MVMQREYQNRKFANLDAVVQHFYAEVGVVATRACFGVAGAVVEGASLLPNLNWRLSENALADTLALESMHLLNDLEANALGVMTHTPQQFFVLNPGQPRPGGNRALIAAGTGLGEAYLFHTPRGYQVYASEGGHVDFAPRGEIQIGLLRYLATRYAHVSFERVLSGSGLVNIHAFLRDEQGMAEPRWLTAHLRNSADGAAEIAKAGLAGEAASCVEALRLFLEIYGAARRESGTQITGDQWCVHWRRHCAQTAGSLSRKRFHDGVHR